MSCMQAQLYLALNAGFSAAMITVRCSPVCSLVKREKIYGAAGTGPAQRSPALHLRTFSGNAIAAFAGLVEGSVTEARPGISASRW